MILLQFENDAFEIERDDEVYGVEYLINDDENALLDEVTFVNWFNIKVGRVV